MGKLLISVFVICLIVLPLLVSAAAVEDENNCGCSAAVNTATVLKYKIIAILSTLIFGVFGVCLPIYGVDLDNPLFTWVKAYAAGAFLIIGNIFILHYATESLTSSYMGDEPPWGDFPMAPVVAMAAAIITVIESFASASFMNRSHFGDKQEENQNGDQIHASQGHSHGSISVPQHGHNNTRQKVVELGIVVHSVIIGISLGASPGVSTIKPLIAALTFHQFFQGIGLGRRISQAKYELKKSLVMVIVFALTTPVGIGIGIGVVEIYKERSPTTLMVSGFLKAAAAGRLMFMAMVTNYNFKPHRRFHMLLAYVYVFTLLLVHFQSFSWCALWA